ncbi:MAG: TlpA disulfide reductase family protein [Oscillospiraceae bacterium]|nr:TlpA disulfide reductase family protein [Oscillospiraceae bacterium]
MKSKKTVLILVAVLAVLLVAAGILYRKFAASAQPAPQTQTDTQTGGQADGGTQTIAAPDFSMQDADGNAVSFADITASGKPVILNFWTSWCGYCKQEMPDFEAAYKKYGDRIEFVMLNAATNEYTQGDGAAYVESKGYTFPVYYDTDGAGVSTYGLNGFPATVVVGTDGNIVYARTGMLTADNLQTLIDSVLK